MQISWGYDRRISEISIRVCLKIGIWLHMSTAMGTSWSRQLGSLPLPSLSQISQGQIAQGLRKLATKVSNHQLCQHLKLTQMTYRSSWNLGRSWKHWKPQKHHKNKLGFELGELWIHLKLPKFHPVLRGTWGCAGLAAEDPLCQDLHFRLESGWRLMKLEDSEGLSKYNKIYMKIRNYG